MAEELKRKSFATKTLGVNLEERTVTHYVTTPTVDEQAEVLLPRGADISRFTKSPTVFDVHQYGSKDVVGTAIDYKITDEGHIATTKFAVRPPENLLPAGAAWNPDILLHLYNTGDIKGWSIGFNPMDWREPSKKDIEQFGERVKLVHTRYRVLEYSVAPLPCNEDCLTLVQRGIISKRLGDKLKSGSLPKIEDVAKPKKIIVVVPAMPQKKAETATVQNQLNLGSVVTMAIKKARGQIYHE